MAPGVWLTRRLLASLALCFLAVTTTFWLHEWLPGAAAVDRDPGTTRARLLAEREADGLEGRAGERYVRWIGRLGRGDLGVSTAYRRSVGGLLRERLPPTLALAVTAIVIQVVLAIPWAVVCARRPSSTLDRAARWVAGALYSLPTFWAGLLVLRIFSHELGWMPPGGVRSTGLEGQGAWPTTTDAARHLVLPALVLGVSAAAGLFRLARNELLDAFDSEPLLAARGRGVSERRLAWRHALPLTAGPLLQAVAVSVPSLLGGALVTEVVFGRAGLGSLSWEAFLVRDPNVLLGCTVVTSVGAVTATLLADLVQAAADPRVRHD